MNHTEARQKIRDNLESGHLPKDFDLTSLAVGCAPNNQNCAGCCELFSGDEISAIAHTRSGQKYWFHRECEKLWRQERYSQTEKR
jgi:hypothetical protein